MVFRQLIINIDSKRADRLSDIFTKYEVLSVSIEDQFEGTDKEQPIFNEPGTEVEELWQHSRLSVLINDSIDIDKLIIAVTTDLDSNFNFIVENVDNQDWVRLTQSQFEPIKINDKLYIVPSWHKIPNSEATGIILDPGLAFGTGSHSTTAMCLNWLSENINNSHNVLDYGCGSGILAITAKKFGAREVIGVDIDSQAIEASNNNSQVNGVDLEFCLPNQFVKQQFDVVVANILSNPLRMLAAALASYVKPGGNLILSGILESQIEEMSEIYSQWFEVKVYKIVEGWVSLACVKTI